MTRVRRVGIGLSLEEAALALLTLGQLLRRRLLRLLRDDERCERSLHSARDNRLSDRSHSGRFGGSRGRSHISSVGSSKGNGDCCARDRGVSGGSGCSSCNSGLKGHVGSNLSRCFFT
jgi:hypothetical protein